jgi:DNA-binding transcriptional LysR family regulator
VSAPSALGRAHVSPVCRDLASIHAKLAIDLVLTDRLVNLIEEGLDVVVRVGAPKDSGLVMRKLANNHRIVVGAPDYLARRGAPAVPPDLEHHTCLHYRGAGTLWRLIGPDGKAAEFRSASRACAATAARWPMIGRSPDAAAMAERLSRLCGEIPDMASTLPERSS